MAKTRATVKDIKSAVRSVVGFMPAELRVAERGTASVVTDDGVGFGRSYNELDAVADGDITDDALLDADLLKGLSYERGVLLDLYVYRKTQYDTELETNVSVVIDSSGEVLVAYDNVGHAGFVADEWWCGREVKS